MRNPRLPLWVLLVSGIVVYVYSQTMNPAVSGPGALLRDIGTRTDAALCRDLYPHMACPWGDTHASGLPAAADALLQTVSGVAL